MPAALLLYLFWRKQWRRRHRPGSRTLLSAGIRLTFSPDTLSAYWRNFFVMGEPGTLFAMPPNQSLNGLWRLWRLHRRREPSTASTCSGAVVVAAITLCWPMRRLPAWWRYEFALIVCAINLITPYAWYHQLALLYIPLHRDGALWAARRLTAGRGTGLLALTNLHGLLWHSFESSRWLTNFSAGAQSRISRPAHPTDTG